MAPRVRALTKQSKGRTSSTIASTLIAIWIVRFIPQLQRITKIGIAEAYQAREAIPSYMNVISFGPFM